MKRLVVVHCAGRDNNQVAQGLFEAGLLESFVTNMYWKGPKPWVNTVRKVLGKKWSDSYHNDFLESKKVYIDKNSLIRTARKKFFGDDGVWDAIDKSLGSHAREIALKTNANILAYSTYARSAFAAFDGLKMLFQMHPSAMSVRKILLEEIELTPIASDSLRREYEVRMSESKINELQEEIEMADVIFAASTFTRETILNDLNGKGDKIIPVVPYGVESGKYAQAPQKTKGSNVLKVFFWGSMIQRKGLTYLLEAVKSARKEIEIELELIGRGYYDRNILNKYENEISIITHNKPDAEIIERIQDKDVMVLPSLVEGFGHVILQSMSMGIPVVTTPNTIGRDIIEDGKNGFIVPIRDIENLKKTFFWISDNREQFNNMRSLVVETARQYDWARFRKKIGDICMNLSK